MKKIFGKYLIVCLLAVIGQIFASVGGVIGIVSPRLMYDGRPILWQNLDSDSADVYIKFFKGERYNFFGLMNGEDTSRVYGGLNTAGFAIVFSTFASSSDKSLNMESVFIRQALGICGRLEDFSKLLDSTEISIGTNSSFACMDVYGAHKLFESGVTMRDPFDLKKVPPGFLVRANFHFTNPQVADKSYWRYHRSEALFASESAHKKLHNHIIMKQIARDMASIAVDPGSLSSDGQASAPPAGFIRTEHSVNQYNTVSCLVIQGVRPGENPDFSTMWVILGEPICGVAIPLWPATSQVPLECQLSEFSLNAFFQEQKSNVYYLTNMPRSVDTNALLALRSRMDQIENSVFVETRKALARWREQSSYLQDMIDFQMTTAAFVYRSLKE
ncbi:hypothetical protein EH223_05835 [candidate division KSB1 bacterium]|nr:hypothetical protein [candidate division KSB1 bacterium]RQW05121.1 MAG: hypothetical protein EH223_05835 [candidate division KSB1 bacterium]